MRRRRGKDIGRGRRHREVPLYVVRNGREVSQFDRVRACDLQGRQFDVWQCGVVPKEFGLDEPAPEEELDELVAMTRLPLLPKRREVVEHVNRNFSLLRREFGLDVRVLAVGRMHTGIDDPKRARMLSEAEVVTRCEVSERTVRDHLKRLNETWDLTFTRESGCFTSIDAWVQNDVMRHARLEKTLDGFACALAALVVAKRQGLVK